MGMPAVEWWLARAVSRSTSGWRARALATAVAPRSDAGASARVGAWALRIHCLALTFGGIRAGGRVGMRAGVGGAVGGCAQCLWPLLPLAAFLPLAALLALSLSLLVASTLTAFLPFLPLAALL